MKLSSMGIVLLCAISCVAEEENNSLLAPGAVVEKLADSFQFTEGPAADAEGHVYFTDQPNDRILKWSVDGQLSTFMKPCGRSNGLYIDQDGSILACADNENQLWDISQDKQVTILVKDFQGKLLNGPNDLWLHPSGGIYFTDPLYKRSYWKRNPAMQQPGQSVYYLEPDRKNVRLVCDDLVQPNGIIGAPNGKQLYVADIGNKKTYRFDIADDGSLTNQTLFCEMGSDGMTIDEKGNIYLTGNGVTVFNSQGEQIHHIKINASWTANVTFGGKDFKTLFITASKALFSLKMNVAGARLSAVQMN